MCESFVMPGRQPHPYSPDESPHNDSKRRSTGNALEHA